MNCQTLFTLALNFYPFVYKFDLLIHEGCQSPTRVTKYQRKIKIQQASVTPKHGKVLRVEPYKKLKAKRIHSHSMPSKAMT